MLKFIAALLLISVINADSSADLVNTRVERSLDLTSHLVYVTDKITVENTGKGSQKSYTFVVEPSQANHVSSVTAKLTGEKTKKVEELEKRKMKVTKVSQESPKGQLYKIDFNTELASGQSVTFEVEVTIFDELKPLPAEITQTEKQLVVYTGNQYYYSLYLTKKQTTTFNLASDKTESYSQLKPVSKSDSTITYGPYENVKPFEQNELKVHFENNSPFLRVTNMLRTIEVSHWGNIAVEETIDLSHYGATLKGPFSRFEFMRKQGGASAVKSINSLLPTLATDVYYRDEIGNISTSNLRQASRSKVNEPLSFELRPRFPLFGGWKTHYTIGYNLPIYQYLFTDGNEYVLKMKVLEHIYADQLVDSATVKIILPEYSTNVELFTPYPVNRKADTRHYTYLDTVGRPVVEIQLNDVVDSHIQEFQLKYSYQKTMILKKPLLVVSCFLALFTVIIFLVRLDFSLAPYKTEHTKKD